jgi:hypothetical protein
MGRVRNSEHIAIPQNLHDGRDKWFTLCRPYRGHPISKIRAAYALLPHDNNFTQNHHGICTNCIKYSEGINVEQWNAQWKRINAPYAVKGIP